MPVYKWSLLEQKTSLNWHHPPSWFNIFSSYLLKKFSNAPSAEASVTRFDGVCDQNYCYRSCCAKLSFCKEKGPLSQDRLKWTKPIIRKLSISKPKKNHTVSNSFSVNKNLWNLYLLFFQILKAWTILVKLIGFWMALVLISNFLVVQACLICNFYFLYKI